MFVNAAYDPALASPEALLDRYATLTGWCRAVAEAGADVRVAQRFHTQARIERDDVHYLFLADGGPPQPSVWWASRPLIDAALANRPDVVHVNGLGYPRLLSGIKALQRDAVVVVQDHGGQARLGGAGGFSRWLILRPGLGDADACMFTAIDQAREWRDAGLLTHVPVVDVVESSTALRGLRRDEARARTGVTGDPAILWVGRLDANKDPLTVVDAVDRVLAESAGARAYFVYHDAPLEAAVRERVARSPALASRLTMIGQVPHQEMAAYYSAADLFVSGSRSEGSGYALIEALACGVTPVVTDIPPFRAIAGDVGARFAPGDAEACAAALLRIARTDRLALRRAAQERFDTALTWPAIGARAMAAYRVLTDARAR